MELINKGLSGYEGEQLRGCDDDKFTKACCGCETYYTIPCRA